MTITNPRFMRYAGAHGRTPDEQLAHDRDAWPGGVMVGFTQWMNARHAEYRQKAPAAYMMGGCGWVCIDHTGFDRWLRNE